MNNLKKLLSLFTLLSLLFVFTTCKHEHLQPGNTTTTPAASVFYFTGMVNGKPVSIQSGESNYYMYSNYNQIPAGTQWLYNFTGNLTQTNTTSSPNSIQFIINDYQTTGYGSSQPNIDSSLMAAYYSYYKPGGNPTRYLVYFYPENINSHNNNTTLTYTFGDGSTSTLNNSFPISHTYMHPGDYNTEVNVVFGASNGGGTSSLSNIIKLGTPDQYIYVNIHSNQDRFSDSIVDFLCLYDSSHFSPVNYYWNFGDSTNLTTIMNTLIRHKYLYPGIYHVTVTATDGSGNSTTENINAEPYTCALNYADYYTQKDTISNPNALSNVTIIYTDQSGNTWTSVPPQPPLSTGQPVSSYFKIISVNKYNNNQNNQTTMQLHLNFTCTVYNGTSSMTITNGDAVIAVAYK
jgi:hypothetical protein